mgnify:CR=1 FL=1
MRMMQAIFVVSCENFLVSGSVQITDSRAVNAGFLMGNR